MVYVSPILKNDSLNALYQNEDTYSQVLESETQVRMDELKFDLFLDLIEEQIPDRGNILDIGCGPGLFLALAKKRGWSVTGCEVNKMALSRLKAAGIPVIDRPVEECCLESGSFQCITLLTVLEHIPDPKGLLKKVRTLLQTGGIVAILVPNINALANRILHEKSTTFSGDMHINHFSDTTLGNMLEATGFDVTASETILTNIDSINNYLNYEDLAYGSSRYVLSFLTPEYIHQNQMGYLLFTLAKAR
jgi:2-polyprenyl-3-methyl-5-hydroxy-6-metoxy-1,4-benzoquinol methylase